MEGRLFEHRETPTCARGAEAAASPKRLARPDATSNAPPATDHAPPHEINETCTPRRNRISVFAITRIWHTRHTPCVSYHSLMLMPLSTRQIRIEVPSSSFSGSSASCILLGLTICFEAPLKMGTLRAYSRAFSSSCMLSCLIILVIDSKLLP